MDKAKKLNIEEAFCEYLAKNFRGAANPVSSKTLETADCRQSPGHSLRIFLRKELGNPAFMGTFRLFFCIMEISKIRWCFCL